MGGGCVVGTATTVIRRFKTYKKLTIKLTMPISDFSSKSKQQLTATFPAAITGNGNGQLLLSFPSVFLLSRVTSSASSLRLRLYLSQSFAAADINRAVGGSLPTSHGLIYEAVLSGGVTALDVLPAAIASPSGQCCLVVNNLGATNVTPTIIFDYLGLT